MKMNDKQFQFIIEEYKSLKAELLALVKELRTLETIIIASIALVYVWIAKQSSNQIYEKVLWIPILFPLLGAFRQGAIFTRIIDISEYIQLIEKKFELKHPPGWERFLKQKRSKVKGKAIAISGFIFWLILLMITIVIPLTVDINAIQ